MPLALVTSDDAGVAEAQALLPDVEGVTVKWSRSPAAAVGVHPSEAQRLVREGSAKAVRAVDRFEPFSRGTPVRFEIDFAKAAMADRVYVVPPYRRTGPRTVTIEALVRWSFIAETLAGCLRD